MKTRAVCSAVLTVAVLLALRVTAEAQLPKEGTVSWTHAYSGVFKAVPAGDTFFLGTFDDTGVVVDVTGNGAQLINNASARCFGTARFVDGFGKYIWHCVSVDPAGDQIVWEGESADHQLGKLNGGKFMLLGGTGKFKGIRGTGKYDNFGAMVKPAADGTYQGYSKATMSFTLP